MDLIKERACVSQLVSVPRANGAKSAGKKKLDAGGEFITRRPARVGPPGRQSGLSHLPR